MYHKLIARTTMLGLGVAAFAAALPLTGDDGKQRTIVFNEDRAQHYMTSKVYELKHVSAHDLLPFIKGAVKRFDAQSTVQSLDYKAGDRQFLVVSTGKTMLPYVDQMIAALDYPSKKVDENGTAVSGDGITRYSYCADYRGSDEMLAMLDQTFAPAGFGGGSAYFDRGTNMFIWKSSKSQADEFMKFLKAVDRPVPQLQLELKVYVVSDNNFRELGIDYVAWKNGPGADILSAGFDFSNFYSKQGIENFASLISDGPVRDATGLGAIMVAPNFDATFLRMLAQNGKANVATGMTMTVTNDFTAVNSWDEAKYRFRFTPEFQQIQKDAENQNTSVTAVETTEFEFYISAPMICFGDDPAEGAQTLMGNWVLTVSTPVETDNLGTVTTDSNTFNSSLTLNVGTEMLVAAFDKSVEVEQYNSVPFLGEIPVLRYLFGAESKVKSKFKVFVTLTATPVVTKNSPDAAIAAVTK